MLADKTLIVKNEKALGIKKPPSLIHQNYIIASEQSIYFLSENIFKQLVLSSFPHINNQSFEAWLQCKVKVVFYVLQAAEFLFAYVIQMSSCLKYLCTFVTAKKKKQVLFIAFDLVNLKFHFSCEINF